VIKREEIDGEREGDRERGTGGEWKIKFYCRRTVHFEVGIRNKRQ